MPKLYELTGAYNDIWELVNDETTDLTVIEDTLQSIEGAIEEKATNIVKFIRSMEFDVDAIKTEEKRLADRRRAVENRIQGIKDYIKAQMEKAGLDKIKTPILTIALQNNPPAVNIIEQDKIPASYITIVPEQYIPNKKAICDALKAGQSVPGCELTQGKSLRIR